MTWRRLHLLLCLLMVFIGIVRLLTGHLIGAIIPLLLAVVFGAVAYNYPLGSLFRRLWRIAKRLVRIS